MMEFIITTLSFTVAIILASVLGMLIMLNPKVFNWYMKKVNQLTMKLFGESLMDDEEL